MQSETFSLQSLIIILIHMCEARVHVGRGIRCFALCIVYTEPHYLAHRGSVIHLILTGVIQSWETPFIPPRCLLELRCAITPDDQAYIRLNIFFSVNIPANINDVFLISVHREFRGCRQNKQQGLGGKKLKLHGRESFLCTSKMPKAGFRCVFYSVHNLIRLNNCCSAKRRLPGGETCPFSSRTLLTLLQFFSAKDCCHVLFQLMRKD